MNNERHVIKILAVDDDHSIIDSYKQVFINSGNSNDEPEAHLQNINNDLSNEQDTKTSPAPIFKLSTCNSGQEALPLILKAKKTGQPFSVAFVDIVRSTIASDI